MLSRPQQILLKRAQKEAALDDSDYRQAIALVSGVEDCCSSKDHRLTDRHLDLLLGYFEAIHWRKVDSGELQPSCKSDAVFRQRHFWAQKNTRQENSRDRFTASKLANEISDLEHALSELGFGAPYCAGIRERVTGSRSDAHALHQYKAALRRTLSAKRKRAEPEAADLGFSSR